MKLTERSTSSRFASRCVDCLGGRPFAISQSGAPRHPGPPRRRVERDIPTAASLRSFRGRRVRPIDPPTCPPMTIRDRREGQPRIDQPSMSRPLQRELAREHRCDSTFDGLVQNHRSQVCSETFRGTRSDLRKHQRTPRRTSSMASCGGTNPVISPPQDSPRRPTAGLYGARTTTAGM
jgi:hypothetical protein